MAALPSTAAGWAALSVRTGQRVYDETWKDGALPPPERHMVLANVLVSSCIEAVLWEALRLSDPAVADRLAADITDLCEAGDSFGELLYEWQERLRADQPLSGSLIYDDLWQRAGLPSARDPFAPDPGASS
jgi:hypothetical protein